jgi:hypothetical protein
MTEISRKNRLIGFKIGAGSLTSLTGYSEHAMVIYGYQMIAGELNLWIYDPQGTAFYIAPSSATILVFPENGAGITNFSTPYSVFTSILPGNQFAGYTFAGYYYDVRPLNHIMPDRPR